MDAAFSNEDVGRRAGGLGLRWKSGSSLMQATVVRGLPATARSVTETSKLYPNFVLPTARMRKIEGEKTNYKKK